MKWFFKRHIFSNVAMKTIVYDLSNHPEKKDHTQIYINNKKLNCFVVKKLEPQLNEKIEQTISRMDIKPSFDINEIQKRLAKGFFFAVAMVEDKVIGWTWGAVNKVYFEDFNCWIKITDSFVFTYNTFVDKDYRGKRVGQYLKDEMCHCLKSNGYIKIWGLVHTWNKASLKSNLRFGFKLSGDYRFIKLFGLNLHFPKVT